MTISEVAHFRREQALQEEAAQRGLCGPAIVASHAIITARFERDAGRLNARVRSLIEQGKREEARAVLLAYDPEQGIIDE
jgi:hypothetical protein